jgi:acyl-CoA synthetase (NDP forming)
VAGARREPGTRAPERRSLLPDGRVLVAEPDVKAHLAAAGISVPTGIVVDGSRLSDGTGAGLRAPLVLKAFGPGVVHKTDVGAVALGIDHRDLPTASAAMAARLRSHGLAPAGFLVEEQADPGIELIVGVVRRPPFGLVVAVGLGGTLTEVLDQVAVALWPLSEADARHLVATFPGHAALDGVRGAPGGDRAALVALLLAIAGADGVVAGLGDALDELECNPVRVSAAGAVALDARLVLRPPDAIAPRPVPPPVRADPAHLFRPRAIAVAGASTNRPGFGNRALAAYRAVGWTDGLYAIHPTATEVDGVPARPTVAATGAPVDYLLVAVPAERCADVVRETGGAVPFVQVVSGGFGEVGPDGERRADELVRAARGVGCRLLGPNCMGVYAPAGRQTFLLGAPSEPGHVGVVSQSGGLSGDVIQAGGRRGLRFSAVASVGNAVDVTPGELAGWLLADPDTHVLGVYLEGTADAAGLVAALRRARGRTPVVLLLGGSSAQGAAAVASHTGSLVGDRRTWEAVAAATGATIVGSLEHLLAVLVHLQRWARTPPPPHDGGGVLVVGVGGGASVLATDACDRAGLELTPTPEPVRAHLRDLGYGVGTSVANPLEIPFGPVAPTDALRRVLRPVLDGAPYADVLLHVNVAAYYSYGDAGLAPLLTQLDDLVAADLPARIAVVTRNVECATGVDADRLRAHAADLGLSLHADLDQAAVAIAAVRHFTDARAGSSADAAADA